MAEWNEEDHPRDENGRFGEGGGGGDSGGSDGGSESDGSPDPHLVHEHNQRRLASANERLSAAKERLTTHKEAHERDKAEIEQSVAKIQEHGSAEAAGSRAVAQETRQAVETLKAKVAEYKSAAKEADKAGDEDRASDLRDLHDEAKAATTDGAKIARKLERNANKAEQATAKAVEAARVGNFEKAQAHLEKTSRDGYDEAADILAHAEVHSAGLNDVGDLTDRVMAATDRHIDRIESTHYANGINDASELVPSREIDLRRSERRVAKAERAVRVHEREVKRIQKAIDRDGDGKTNEVERGTTEADLKPKGHVQTAPADRQIWKVEARSSAKALELDIYDDIGGIALLGGGVTAARVRAALKGQNPKETIVRIHSAGGIVLEGLAIYNLFKQMAGKVICRVDSLAGSIASVIAMGGDELEMAEQSFLMIHNPFGMVEGGAAELRSQANLLDTMREQMLDIYCSKCGRSREEVGRLMDEETWMTARDALAFGFCDRIVPDNQNKLVAHVDLTGFKRAPKTIAPVASVEETTTTAAAEATEQQESTMSMTAEETQKMADLEAAVATLTASLETEKGARASAEEALAKSKPKAETEDDDDDEDDDEEEEMAKAALLTHVQALTGHKEATGIIGALESHIGKLSVTTTKKTVAERVSALIAAGKLAPARKAAFLKMSLADIDVYERGIGDARIVAVSEEHTPNENHENVVQARANTTAPSAKFDPESIQLDATDLHYCKVRDPHGTEKLAEKYLDQKRADAKLAFEKKHGRFAA